jgi:hypothetical protein
MKRERILTVVAMLMVAWPVAGQDAVKPAGPGVEAQVERKGKEADPPSLHLGAGTRVDVRLRLQSDLQDSDASLPDGDDGSSEMDVARRRIGIDGEILNIVDYQSQSSFWSRIVRFQFSM